MKILLPPFKFIPSLATVENPSIFATTFDPLLFLNDYTKSKQCTLSSTKLIHAQLLKTTQLQSDIFVANSLLDCYCKSAAMANAEKLFDTIPHPNVITWNIMISGYNHNFSFENSWRAFCRMHSSGFKPSEITYGSVLSASTSLQTPMLGKQIYSLATKHGLFSNGYVRAGIIDLFAKNYSFANALKVFYDVSCENVVCWNATISGAVINGENWVALNLFQEMCNEFLLPNSFTFSSILSACATLEELEIGKRVQGLAIKCGAEDVFVGTTLIDMYSKCGDMDEAVKKFLRMPVRNVVSWTVILSGFVKKNDSHSALRFFRKMRQMGEEINSYTITSMLTACAKPNMIEEAIQLHSFIIKTGFFSDSAVRASLINTYSKTGGIHLSSLVFKEMENKRDISLWNAMITSFAQNQDPETTIDLFRKMLKENVRPDKFCSSSVLSVTDCLILGKQIHCYILKTGLVFDVSVGSSLFTMYSKCGNIEESYIVFKNMLHKDNVSWASMISGFSEHGYADEAIKLFREMLFEETMPDHITLTAVLIACSTFQSLQRGREIHGFAFRAGLSKDLVVGSAVVTMYSKCGKLEYARRVFEKLPEKDPFACSSLVSGYAQQKHIRDAILLFHDMLAADLFVDTFSISSVLGAIALMNRPVIGTQLHSYLMKVGFETDVSVGSSLVTMYSKCGSIEDCNKAFSQIEKPDLIGWTAMIVSYAQHGKGAEALRVYELMKKEGIRPDAVTFVGVLSACSHSGLVEEAYFYLNSMAKDYGMEPGYRHYACMVDLLGRSGRLEEAERFINEMPIKPDGLVWGTLLAACKLHGDIELGKKAARKVMELKPCDSGTYVSLSNICADVGEWEEVLKIRSLMTGSGLKKEPGWSYV